jgi:G3E family GTPase
MTVHIVGGFLGSGKTTAILGAARIQAARGLSVGVVMNDQGRGLVDTRTAESRGLAVSEVTGGCFCCNFQDFEAAVERMAEGTGPDVVFAEPVGSCTDLVATVLKPLAATSRGGREIGRLSVFTDIRLLRQRLAGRALPFSADVQYIFDAQLEEADVLVLNKADLLPAAVAEAAAQKARERYPDKTLLLQSSLDPADLQRWTGTLDESPAAPRRSILVDYDRYARGEIALAWYDASLVIELSEHSGPEVTRRLIDELRRAAFDGRRAVGHLKVHFRHEDGAFTSSITEDPGVPPETAEVTGRRLEVMINARAEDASERLASALREAVDRAVSGAGLPWRLLAEEAFHPSIPRPFVRMP